MKYDRVISNAFDNGKMLYEMKEMREIEKLFIGLEFKWDYVDSYCLIYQKEMMYMRCHYSNYELFFPSMKVAIIIDRINVYGNGWIHDVPEKMKTYIYSQLDNLRSFNEYCDNNKLSKRFKEYKKQLIIEEIRVKKEKYDKDQKELFKKFN